MSDDSELEASEQAGRKAAAETIADAVSATEGPHIVNRRGLKIIAISVSVAGLLLVGAMLYLYAQNRNAIHQLNALTHPTPQQYRTQLRRGIKLCLREPECRHLFPQITTSKQKREAALKAIRHEQRRELRVAARRILSRRMIAHNQADHPPHGSVTHPVTSPPSKRRPVGHINNGSHKGDNGSGNGGGNGNAGGGGSGGGGGPNPSPVVRTPTVEIPATPATPAVTVPSVEVPCPDLKPIAHC